MIETSAAEADANQRVVDVHGQSYVLREYVGNAPRRGIYVEGNESNDNLLPQGFLVTQPPGSVTRPHFHETNQFQVFVSGDGKFGKKPAAPLTVQYASGHTPYGPITAGSNGIMYFTLRQRWDPGAKYMPQMREKLVRGRQRQRLVPCAPLTSGAALKSAKVDVQYLIEAEPDGLMALDVHMGADQQVALPAAAEGGGQYHIVVQGSIVATEHADEHLGQWACQYVFAHDPPTADALRAGPTGARVLVLRFPRINHA